ncbi:MAG: hypothetical protein R3228_09095 [Halioglobus sp.]|nr:hypothetical protein [Halioglobus sp.]
MDQDIRPAGEPSNFAHYPPTDFDEPLRRSVRAKIFVLIAATATIVGLVVTALQPSVFRASATVLMTAPVAIDDEEQEANVQGVAIQRRILLGSEVTEQLQDALARDGFAEVDKRFLRETLSVSPVPETNLVEMSASGEDRKLLPVVVNTWIDVYSDIRAAGIQQSQQQTLRLVRDQLAGLEVKLEEARSALALYRKEHNITSAERQENEVMSRLEGLNEALNKAIELEVLTAARLRTMENALAQGKQIVAASDRESVAEMENELRGLQNRLKNLGKTYTIEYIRKQPRLRNIPVRIAELEQALKEIYAKGEDLQLSIARQEHEAAQQSVIELRAQLKSLEQDAAAFTTIYATHQALAEDLARLEDLNRETQARLIEVQVNPVDKYPQVSIIDRPRDSERMGPDYLLWLGGTAATALVLGILGVWLHGFLSPRKAQPAFVTLSGVHMYPQDVSGNIGYGGATPPQLAQAQAHLLASSASETGQTPQSENGDDPDKNPKDDGA